MEANDSNKLKCDILLLTATPTEYEELRRVAVEKGIAFEKQSINNLSFVWMGTVGTTRVNAVQTEMGPFSYGGSASRAIYFKIATGATGLIQIGMAFGIDERGQNMGDVLVSTHLIPYDRREAITTNSGCSLARARVWGGLRGR